AFTRSPKNDAPRWSSASSTARAECESGRLAGSGCTVRDRQTAPRSLRNNAIGVVRIGPDLCPFDDAAGDSRPQAISPERHRPSSHNGSYSPSRAGSTSASQAPAGTSYPSSSSSTAPSPSGPSALASGATRDRKSTRLNSSHLG